MAAVAARHHGFVARLLLILPTGTYRAEEYLAAAERLGADVVVGSERAQALAATMGESFLELPLDRPAEAAALVASHGRRLHLDAVVAVDDQGLLTAALAAELLGLRHNPPRSVALTRDKAAMRAAFAAAGVPQPDFVVASSGSADEVAEAAARLGFPVVVKPCTLSGSRGVVRADSARQAAETAGRVGAILEEEGEPPGPASRGAFRRRGRRWPWRASSEGAAPRSSPSSTSPTPSTALTSRRPSTSRRRRSRRRCGRRWRGRPPPRCGRSASGRARFTPSCEWAPRRWPCWRWRPGRSAVAARRPW